MANKLKLLELLLCVWVVGVWKGRDKEADFIAEGQLDHFPVSQTWGCHSQ